MIEKKIEDGKIWLIVILFKNTVICAAVFLLYYAAWSHSTEITNLIVHLNENYV